MVYIYMHMLDGGLVVSFFYNKLYFQLYLIFMKSIFSRLNPLNINMNIYIYIYPCVWGTERSSIWAYQPTTKTWKRRPDRKQETKIMVPRCAPGCDQFQRPQC